jgi:hypothetical protein
MALYNLELGLVIEIDVVVVQIVVLVIAVDKAFAKDDYSMNSLDIESVLVVVVPSVYQLVLLPMHLDPLIENVNIQVERYSMHMGRKMMAFVAFVVASCMDHLHRAFVVVHRPLAFLRQVHVLHIDVVAAAAVAVVVVVVVVTSIVVIVVEDVPSSWDIHPQLDYLFHHCNMLDVVRMVVGKVN